MISPSSTFCVLICWTFLCVCFGINVWIMELAWLLRVDVWFVAYSGSVGPSFVSHRSRSVTSPLSARFSSLRVNPSPTLAFSFFGIPASVFLGCENVAQSVTMLFGTPSLLIVSVCSCSFGMQMFHRSLASTSDMSVYPSFSNHSSSLLVLSCHAVQGRPFGRLVFAFEIIVLVPISPLCRSQLLLIVYSHECQSC